MSKARQLADLGNVYDDGALSNRNFIVNGEMQICQRGTSVSFGAAYTLDRWRIVGGASPARVATQESNTSYSTVPHEKFLKCTNPQGQDMWTTQRIENARQFSGKTLTLSYWIWSTTGSYSATSGSWGKFQSVNGGTEYNVSGWGGASVSVTTTPQYVTHTINFADISSNVHTEGDFFEWNIYHNTTNDICITGVQLELGDTATPFEHRSYGDELARCQRYYQRQSSGTQSYPIGSIMGYIYGSNIIALGYTPPVAMRTTPTIGEIGGSGLCIRGGQATGTNNAENISSFSAIDSNASSFGIGAASNITFTATTDNSNLHIGRIGCLCNNGDNTNAITFDAEL